MVGIAEIVVQGKTNFLFYPPLFMWIGMREWNLFITMDFVFSAPQDTPVAQSFKSRTYFSFLLGML